MDKPGTKYALLIAPDVDQSSTATVQLAGLRCYRGRLRDFVPPDELQAWEKAFGSFDWASVQGDKLLVLATMPSERAHVYDGENNDLASRVTTPWRALTLVDTGEPMHGKAWVVTGALESDSPLRLASVRTCGALHAVLQPYYATEASRAKTGFAPPKSPSRWAQDWSEIFDLLSAFYQQPTPSRLLDHGLFAFQYAQQVPEIEFRIPNFVRAAETIMALPKGKGKVTFAKRGTLLAGALKGHRLFAGRSLFDWLLLLFESRSECVHGKIPFATMIAEGGDHETDAAKLEYLAEHVARQAITAALRSAHQPFMRDREDIDQAWEKGLLP